MPEPPSAYARLTEAMELVGVHLEAGSDGKVRLRCHPGDEVALERWSVPAVLDYIVWRWLRTPLDDLPEGDRRALYGTLGVFGRTGSAL